VTATAPAVGPLAETLRAARKGCGLSIAELAALAKVSPRLISELERGKRAHVSFETAMRLVQLVGVTVTFDGRPARADEAARRRAEQRRKHWTGEQSILSKQAPPPASSDAVARLTAVANASRIVAGLQHAYRTKTVRPRSPKSAE
jgi:transcriptional regulator with XRE-family HTH domain